METLQNDIYGRTQKWHLHLQITENIIYLRYNTINSICIHIIAQRMVFKYAITKKHLHKKLRKKQYLKIQHE